MLRLLRAFFPEQSDPREARRLIGLMSLFFLVVCAVGMLRPVKNAIALDGLGATDFYKVYLVSASVIVFVPLYNKLSDLFSWRWLIPVVALSFAIELVLFRIFYVEGSTLFGLLFYGWYDLFAAALVTQFFMAMQLFLDARSAKAAYPLVIAGGSLGATLGGATTGMLSERVGTPNLLLLAAGLITGFAVAMPFVWGDAPVTIRLARQRERAKLDASGVRAILANRQVRLIAASVLLTIVVKELVDYQFNVLSKEIFQTRDAISAFQGHFNAITSWLPALFLVPLHPLMRRFGVGLALLLLPAAMLLTNLWLLVAWGFWAAVASKGAETSLRYSTERAAREILYVPIPEEIKLKAKAYIDVAVEKGLGKVVSAALIFALLQFMNYRQLTWVTVLLSIAWLVAAFAMKREYVETLRRSIEGRFASLRGAFASLADASTLEAVGRALASRNPLQAAFALDLVSQAQPAEVRALAGPLYALAEHERPALRARALSLLARVPDAIDAERVRKHLHDADPDVREAAVHALHAGAGPRGDDVMTELLHSSSAAVRTATLAVAAAQSNGRTFGIGPEFLEEQRRAANAGDPDARLELALALGAQRHDLSVAAELAPLTRDPDPRVARAAVLSVSRLDGDAGLPLLIDALGRPATRGPARAALVARGAAIAPVLSTYLLDERVAVEVRRNIPAVLGRVPDPGVANALLQAFMAPETDQLLDDRALVALGKLRQRNPQLQFDRDLVSAALDRELAAAASYELAGQAITILADASPGSRLLARSLDQAREERQASAFRLLGLIYPADSVAHCHTAIANGIGPGRSNAIEWLEETLSRDMFDALAKLLLPRPSRRPIALGIALDQLRVDNDRWLARLALWTAAELRLPATPDWIAWVRPTDPQLALRLQRAYEAGKLEADTGMDLIEKVFLLQEVDLLREAKSAHLALLASVAEVLDLPADRRLIERSRATDALYVVIDGEVRLTDASQEIMTVSTGEAVGTWALIDDAPALVEAVTVRSTRALRITREDFQDLLSDHPELAVGLLQGLARRIRTVVGN